jgi:glyoxylase-like metal-dependent hydrolase (beta-lactamase superfamily II)
VLTGDSLFVGDAARPDLAVDARAGAEGLFHSLRRLVELGDGVEVYP